jgi:hypothetical protein
MPNKDGGNGSNVAHSSILGSVLEDFLLSGVAIKYSVERKLDIPEKKRNMFKSAAQINLSVCAVTR